MRRRDRTYQWLREHPLAVDTAVAVALLVLLGGFSAASGGWGSLGLAAGLLLPLALRRSRPVLAAALVATTAYTQVATSVPPAPADAGVLGAVYALAAYAPRWATRAGLALALLGSVLAGAAYSEGDVVVGAIGAVLGLSLVSASWALGDVRRSRVAQIGALHERTRHLELERDAASRLAAAEERARIAREMHDVVAHSLSVVIAQSDGGRYAAANDPAAAAAALGAIGDTGRAALADMRRLLGVLSTAESTGTAPQPGVAELPALIAGVRESGLPVEHMVQGRPRPLPRGLDLAVYRVVQESLTNVLKHAGPAARAEVVLRWQQRCLEVAVRDDGRGAASESALEGRAGDRDEDRGRGLVGMRERVALYGGRLSAAPRPGGGFAVDAALPYPEDRR